MMPIISDRYRGNLLEKSERGRVGKKEMGRDMGTNRMQRVVGVWIETHLMSFTRFLDYFLKNIGILELDT
jgi:hypothetical protein